MYIWSKSVCYLAHNKYEFKTRSDHRSVQCVRPLYNNWGINCNQSRTLYSPATSNGQHSYHQSPSMAQANILVEIHNSICREKSNQLWKAAKSSQSAHHSLQYTMYWSSFQNELEDLLHYYNLYTFLMFWKTASLIFDQINQHNFTCLGEKQQKLASHKKTARNILEIHAFSSLKWNTRSEPVICFLLNMC